MDKKLLLCIFTCHRYQYSDNNLIKDWFTRPVVNRVQAVRDTWLKDVTCDYKFFYGRSTSRKPLPDEVFLDSPDDYLHSTDKMRALIRYALDNGYERILKADDDIFIYWDRLMANIPEGHYAGGGPFGGHPPHSYLSGNIYWLTKHAMEILTTCGGGSWAEDRWVGEALLKRKILPTIDYRYFIAPPTRTNQYISDVDLAKPHDYISIHSLSPEQMRRHWEETRHANNKVQKL
jgi:hypothetical protein